MWIVRTKMCHSTMIKSNSLPFAQNSKTLWLNGFQGLREKKRCTLGDGFIIYFFKNVKYYIALIGNLIYWDVILARNRMVIALNSVIWSWISYFIILPIGKVSITASLTSLYSFKWENSFHKILAKWSNVNLTYKESSKFRHIEKWNLLRLCR